RSKRDWSSDVCSSDLTRALERVGMVSGDDRGLNEIVVAEPDIADRVDEVPAREEVRDLPVSGAVVGEVGGHGFIGDVEVDAVQIPPVGEFALEGGEELFEERAVGGVGCGRVPAEVRAGAAGVGGEIEGGCVFGAPLGE